MGSSFFRRAKLHETVRYETPDGGDWVELRAELSKGEMNKIALSAPRNTEDMERNLAFVERIAELLIVDWSMTDEDGNKIPFSLEEYRALAPEPSQWLDSTLSQHFVAMTGKVVEELEGKPSS